ncbi:hypothetical protein A5712_29775 [Mycobacterium sp. E2327]|nr:hypothetical protein A5712_29775 [Mycobacterium sp. E2327]
MDQQQGPGALDAGEDAEAEVVEVLARVSQRFSSATMTVVMLRPDWVTLIGQVREERRQRDSTKVI